MKCKNKNVNREFLTSAEINTSTYLAYLERLRQVAISQFEWINLPKSMNAQFLERCLYDFGKASLLKTKEYGFINAKAVGSSELNIYMLPSSINCFSTDSFNVDRKLYNGFKGEEESEYEYCILVKNNQEMIPTEPTLRLFAMRLYEAERTADVNIKSQKTPVLLVGDDSLKLAMKNLFEKYDGNEPVIYADKKQLNADTLRAIKTEAPFIADKIMEYKKEIWNEALTFLGIDNISTEKKERLISGEATSNNELINLNLQNRLLVRKEACKQFNELFNLTGENAIDVRVRSDLYNMIKTYDSTSSEFLDKDKTKEVKTEGGEENV